MSGLILALLVCGVDGAMSGNEVNCDERTLAAESGVPPVDSGSAVSEGVSFRKLRTPSYPSSALKHGTIGTVFVHVWVRKDGSVSRAVVEDLYPKTATTLTENLTDVVQSWQFNPAVIRGKKIDSEVIVPIRFGTKEHAPPSPLSLKLSLPSSSILDAVEVRG